MRRSNSLMTSCGIDMALVADYPHLRRCRSRSNSCSDLLANPSECQTHRPAPSTAAFICATQFGITRRYDALVCSGPCR